MGNKRIAVKQRKYSDKSRANLIPFAKDDARINRNGRPSDHAQLRALIQELAGEQIVIKGAKLTRLEHMLLDMFKSRSPADRQNVLEHGYGKVPQAINLTVDDELRQLGIDPAEAEGDLAAAIAASTAGDDASGNEAGESEADKCNPG